MNPPGPPGIHDRGAAPGRSLTEAEQSEAVDRQVEEVRARVKELAKVCEMVVLVLQAVSGVPSPKFHLKRGFNPFTACAV